MRAAAGVAVVGLAYWSVVATVAGVGEPWDADAYWTVGYPLSIGLVALCGRIVPRGAVWWGAIVTFAQLPVMLRDGVTPYWGVGVVFLLLLSIPATLASLLAAWTCKP